MDKITKFLQGCLENVLITDTLLLASKREKTRTSSSDHLILDIFAKTAKGVLYV